MAKPPLGIFGAGWVGLVTGACFAERGHDVVVRDVVPERIESLNARELPFHEPGLAELIERNRERLTFTLDVGELKAGTDLFFACVDTPPTASGDADLSYVWSVIDDLGDPGEATLVMKSTVPVGTGERIRAALDQRGLDRVGYVSNPEFLAEGRAVQDFLSPDRIVIGSFDEAAGDRVAALYDGFDAPIKALALREELVATFPTAPGHRRDLALLLTTCPEQEFRDAGRAVRLAGEAVDLAPQGGDCWRTLGVAHYRAGDAKAAVAALFSITVQVLVWPDVNVEGVQDSELTVGGAAASTVTVRLAEPPLAAALI